MFRDPQQAQAARLADLSRFRAREAEKVEQWAGELAGYMPAPWRGALLADYRDRRAENERDGNTWLRRLVADMQEGAAVGLGLDASDEDIRAAGKAVVVRAFQIAEDLHIKTLAALRARLASLAALNGVKAPEPTVTDEGACRRMTDAAWWVRKLRAAHAQRIESAAIRLGYVHKQGQKYVSDVGVKRRREQKARNAAALASSVATNQDGQEFTLAELAEKSNANPRVRRAELMTRIRGFELIAEGVGHVAEFVTVTAPSRFHAINVDGRRNPKYDGTKPGATQSYLVKQWSLCRAAMGRAGIRPYGFRICEPHHDGCPHWHMLFFLPADQVMQMRWLIRVYFLNTQDGGEPGAVANRCKFESIDPARGGAVAYVSKYVSKNIDGMTVRGDLAGDQMIETSERVETWAAAWRIRQFQQIGGAPVGVWRELRRLKAGEALSDVVEQGRIMADVGKNSEYGESAPGWAGYIALQGGPNVGRRDLAMRVVRTGAGEKMDPTTGEVEQAENCYGEPCAPCVWGVRDMRADQAFLSRRFRWEVRRGVRERGRAAGVGFGGARTRVNNCTRDTKGKEGGSVAGGGFRVGGGGFKGAGGRELPTAARESDRRFRIGESRGCLRGDFGDATGVDG